MPPHNQRSDFMSINLNLDYSILFSSLSTSSSSSSTSLAAINLADYASIRNGSYYQLTKAYYTKNNASDSSSSTSSSDDSTSSLAAVQTDSDSLKDSADKLIKTGTDSLFNKKNMTTNNSDGTTSTTYGYDMESIYKGVKSFVDDYNSMLNSGSNSSNNNVLSQTLNMTNTTKAYSNLLSAVGITVGSDNKLSIDEDAFKTANVSSIKSLFNGNSSYAYSVSAKASQINYYASTANSIYNSNGSLTNSSSSGSLYSSYF